MKEIKKEYRIAQKGKFVINHSIEPKFFGHMVVMVKEHSIGHNITDLNIEELCEFLNLAGKVANIMPKLVEQISSTKVETVYIATFGESKEWHTHIHIIPRPFNIGTVGSKVFDLPTVKLDKTKVQKLVNKLNVELSGSSHKIGL